MRSYHLILCLMITMVLPEPAALRQGTMSTYAEAAPRAKNKPKRKKNRKPKPESALPPLPDLDAPPEAASAPSSARQSSAKSARAPSSSEPTDNLLARAKALYTNLEYGQVIPLAEAVLARSEATIEQQLDAYLLHGSSLAVIGDAIEAEKPFRFLLRGRPDYEMASDTSPKILAVFRKVQVEERAIRNQLRALELERTRKELVLTSATPEKAKGGKPLAFEYRLRDPRGAVSAMEVRYRRDANEPFSSLALKLDDGGAWRAELPGDWTANDRGFVLQYYVTTQDSESNPLLEVGDAAAPLGIMVAPGKVAKAVPAYKTWWFWTAAAGATAAIGVSTWLIYSRSTSLPETAGRLDLKE